jgi:hypothetical protein
MRMHRGWGRLAAAGLAMTVIATSACGPRDTDQQGTDTAATELRVNDVTLGRSIGSDNRVTSRTNEFGLRDTIYVVVETDRSTTGGTLAARWTFEDGQVVDESTRTVGSETVTEFHIVNPNPWPAGRYRVEILVNGAVARTEEFTVR